MVTWRKKKILTGPLSVITRALKIRLGSICHLIGWRRIWPSGSLRRWNRSVFINISEIITIMIDYVRKWVNIGHVTCNQLLMTSILDLGLFGSILGQIWVKFGSISGQVSINIVCFEASSNFVQFLFGSGLDKIRVWFGYRSGLFWVWVRSIPGQVWIKFGSGSGLLWNQSRFGSVVVRVGFGHF